MSHDDTGQYRPYVLPTESELTHERKLEYIVRFERLEDRFLDFMDSDQRWKEQTTDTLSSLSTNVASVALEYKTAKRIGKAFLGAATVLGALLSFLWDKVFK